MFMMCIKVRFKRKRRSY